MKKQNVSSELCFGVVQYKVGCFNIEFSKILFGDVTKEKYENSSSYLVLLK